jgi:hypothetical protein
MGSSSALAGLPRENARIEMRAAFGFVPAVLLGLPRVSGAQRPLMGSVQRRVPVGGRALTVVK